mgnify:CR=1 FL=1
MSRIAKNARTLYNANYKILYRQKGDDNMPIKIFLLPVKLT